VKTLKNSKENEGPLRGFEDATANSAGAHAELAVRYSNPRSGPSFSLEFFRVFNLIFSWKRTQRRQIFLRTVLFFGALAYFATYLMAIEDIRYHANMLLWREALRYVFFPQDMVLYIASPLLGRGGISGVTGPPIRPLRPR